LQKLLDHIPLVIEIGIKEVNINITFWFIKKDSKNEKKFIKFLKDSLKNINASSISSRENL